MPTYEYLCQTCNHRFDIWQKMTDEPLTICPECGSPIHRVLYPTGIVFKGNGFYKTNYQSNGSVTASSNGNSNNSNADPKKDENSSSDKKAEGCPCCSHSSTSGQKTAVATE